IGGVVTGDWGYSLAMKRPVAAIVGLRLRNSALLAGFALLAVVLIAIPLGTLAALRRGRWLDLAILTGSYIGISVPEFVTGMVLILVLAGPSLHLFPTGDYAPLAAGLRTWLSHLVLPALTLTLVLLAHVVRQTRSCRSRSSSSPPRTPSPTSRRTWRMRGSIRGSDIDDRARPGEPTPDHRHPDPRLRAHVRRAGAPGRAVRRRGAEHPRSPPAPG